MSNYLERIILSKKNNFTNTEKILAKYFLSLGDSLINKTIINLADESKCSTASIFKFIKKLGFEGYKDFQIKLAYNKNNPKNDFLLTAITNIKTGDDIDDIASKLILFNIQSMYTILEDLNNIPLNKCINTIKKSNIIHFFGMGASNAIAFDCYHKFLRTNYRVNHIQDFHIMLTYATKFCEDDCIFIFSHSGKTREAIQVAKESKKNNAKVIALTSNTKSEITKLADVSIILPSIEYTYGSESLNTRILYLTIMDAILIAIMYDDPEKNKEAIKKIRDILSTTKK